MMSYLVYKLVLPSRGQIPLLSNRLLVMQAVVLNWSYFNQWGFFFSPESRLWWEWESSCMILVAGWTQSTTVCYISEFRTTLTEEISLNIRCVLSHAHSTKYHVAYLNLLIAKLFLFKVHFSSFPVKISNYSM